MADLAASRHAGVTLDEIVAEFGVAERTAQRMTGALASVFPHAIEIADGVDRKRRWKLREMALARLRLNGPEELAALETAIAALGERGDEREARVVASLRDRLMAALPAAAQRAAETDADAVLEARGVAARPGPAVTVDCHVSEAIAEALGGPYRLVFSYGRERREVEPYGVLLGARRYLVAKQPAKGPELRHFRLDRITDAEASREWCVRDPNFSLAHHAARAFGSFHDERQHGPVVWRFAPHAADRAAEWRFHPRQRTTREEDGSLTVAFEASGWLEMAWHLYAWGDAVEVLEPDALRQLVAGWRRADFEALP